MKPHPFLRAYMAGIVVPTVVLLVAVSVFLIARYGFNADLPVERALVFPLAFVPSLWGVWNMLHLALARRMRIAIGLHGALLPLLLVPVGVWLVRRLDVFALPASAALVVAPAGVIAYFLVWKYVVGFLNAEMGIA